MTYRKRMLATLQGKPTDGAPFVPRLDLWYSANRYNGTLPDQYRKATLRQIGEVPGNGDHLILSIADTAPPGMTFSRLERIARAAKAFGPVRP